MGSILGFLQSIWDMIVNSIQSLYLAIRMVVGSVEFVITFVTYLPAVIGSAIIIFLSVFVIRFLLMK